MSERMPTVAREVHLASRPHGRPSVSDFAIREVELRAPAGGEVSIRNEWLSVDPYMRGRMDASNSYVAPFEVGRRIDGRSVGTVLASRADGVPVGSLVLSQLGWCDYGTASGTETVVLDASQVSASAYLGVLGMTGFTAYVGLTQIAPVNMGDVVYVSAAAGAVGSVAGQIARQLGATRVIGSAGGPNKAASLTQQFGFDAGLDYRASSVQSSLEDLAPDGIDVYFDNVGGDHLHAALSVMRPHGRIALCGAISQYNLPPGQRAPADNLRLAIGKRLTLRGFIVGDHEDSYQDYLAQARRWLAEGTLKSSETVLEGLDNAPQALLNLLDGKNTGKMLIHLT